jgi:hypothetical protein
MKKPPAERMVILPAGGYMIRCKNKAVYRVKKRWVFLCN